MFKKKEKEELKKSFVEISNKQKTLPEQIKDLNDKVEILAGIKKHEKIKPFKLPYKVKSQQKRMAKKGKLIIFALKNQTITPHVTKMKDGYFVFNGVPRIATEYHMFLWMGKIPCVVLPTWDLEAFGTEEYYRKYPEGISLETKEKFVLTAAASGEMKMKGKMETKTIVIFAIIAIVGLYMIFGGNLGVT